MECDFVGFCKLLTPEWLSALADVVGVGALVAGAVIGEQVRRSVERRSKAEQRERKLQHRVELAVRLQALQVFMASSVDFIGRALGEPRPSAGQTASRFRAVANRLSELRFFPEEKASLTIELIMDLLSVSTTSSEMKRLAEGLADRLEQRDPDATLSESELSALRDALDSLDRAQRDMQDFVESLSRSFSDL